MTKSLKIAVAAALCAQGAHATDWTPIGQTRAKDFKVWVKKDTVKYEVIDKKPIITAIARIWLSDDTITFWKVSMAGEVCESGIGILTMSAVGDTPTDKPLRRQVVLGGGNLSSRTADYLCEGFNRQREGDSL